MVRKNAWSAATPFFATTDGRVFFVDDGLWVVTRDVPPQQVLPGATSVFGSGDRVFSIRGESVFTVTTSNQAELLFAGLLTEPGASSHGLVLRDGRLAIVGPRGSLTLRGADGAWQKKALPETKARFAGNSEGETGLVITVDSACSGKDWLCNEPPARGCSAVGGPSVLALLLGLATLRRARRA